MTAPDESTVEPEDVEAADVAETEKAEDIEDAQTEKAEDVEAAETQKADEELRPRRRANPVALVVGLLYVAIGMGVVADHNWGGVDLGAVAGASAVVAGIAVIILIARR